MVGPCRLELQTSSVSRKRSNQLSYGPKGREFEYSNRRLLKRLSFVRTTVESAVLFGTGPYCGAPSHV